MYDYSAHQGPRRASDPQDLAFEMTAWTNRRGCWEQISDPLEGQSMLLAIEPLLQPHITLFKDYILEGLGT